jgi:hypothetical protein
VQAPGRTARAHAEHIADEVWKRARPGFVDKIEKLTKAVQKYEPPWGFEHINVHASMLPTVLATLIAIV